jgi:cytoskeletal protein CcmA (bactofilin family)
MAKDKAGQAASSDSIISIIGPGMRIVGDVLTDGTVRIEGRVEGSVTAAKAVVVGQEGSVSGDLRTQDAIISGTVDGTLVSESRLEVQASARIEGEVRARRLQLEEGAVMNGTVAMGEDAVKSPGAPTSTTTSASTESPGVAQG